MIETRDERLDAALGLLDGPSKARRPGYVPLLALCAFLAATTFFAHILTTPKTASKPAPQSAAPQSAAEPAQIAAFELSGSSLSADTASEQVTDAVLIGKEESR